MSLFRRAAPPATPVHGRFEKPKNDVEETMNQCGYIGRKIQLPKLQEKPAVILAVFGSSSRLRSEL